MNHHLVFPAHGHFQLPEDHALEQDEDHSSHVCAVGHGFSGCANTKETIVIDGVEYPVVKLEISNTSHPFYTGKMKLVDTAGRVDKFYQRYAKKK